MQRKHVHHLKTGCENFITGGLLCRVSGIGYQLFLRALAPWTPRNSFTAHQCMTQFQQHQNRTFYCLVAFWITATLIACMPSIGAAQSGPPIFLENNHYGTAPVRWEAAVADASQCKSFSSADGMVVFTPNGYVELSVGYMVCFGTQTLKYSDGSSNTRFDVPWATTLSCPQDQSILNM